MSRVVHQTTSFFVNEAQLLNGLVTQSATNKWQLECFTKSHASSSMHTYTVPYLDPINSSTSRSSISEKNVVNTKKHHKTAEGKKTRVSKGRSGNDLSLEWKKSKPEMDFFKGHHQKLPNHKWRCAKKS